MLSNRGTVLSRLGACVTDGGAVKEVTIRNVGLMDGIANVVMDYAGLGGATRLDLENSGTMIARLARDPDVWYPSQVAVFSDFTTNTIVNSGTIRGDFNIEGRSAEIVNRGTIVGELALNADTDLRNAGTIRGDISLGLVNRTTEDVVANEAGGTIVGTLRTYDGRDVVTNAGQLGDVDLGYGNDVYRAASTGFATGIVDGGVGNDTVTGGRSADSLLGGHGDDSVDGFGGDDLIDGGEWEDRLFGGGGDDTLYGGFAGQDTMTGGSGRDVFVYAEDAGVDVVADFSQRQGDVIDLTDLDLGSFDELRISHTRTATVLNFGINSFGEPQQLRLLGNIDLEQADVIL